MTDVQVQDTEVFQRFLAAADDAKSDVDADEVSMEIIGRILNATTVDDVLGGQGAIHAEDFLNVPFTLTAVKFNPSDLGGDGPRFYAVLQGVDTDVQPVTVTCGAKNVIAQAWKLNDMGALPTLVQIQRSERPTAAGYYVMWLAKGEPSY